MERDKERKRKRDKKGRNNNREPDVAKALFMKRNDLKKKRNE